MERERVSRRAEDWKKIIEEWSASGERQRDYCAARGIGVSSFYQWRARLKKEKTKKLGGDAFVAMGPVAWSVGSPTAVLRFPDGVKIELSRMPDPEWIRRVVGS